MKLMLQAKAPRLRSRRQEPRPYPSERLSNADRLDRRKERAPEFVEALADAGRTGSALRRSLKAWHIDPKLARLVLLFYGQDRMRVADVAWALNLSPSTASRWLDRAEREGLVDKQYDLIDRRGTWARLTSRGVALRGRVERLLETLATTERPRGAAYGIRATRCWDD
jgi:DNA-binding MarR family transcriptional regulator